MKKQPVHIYFVLALTASILCSCEKYKDDLEPNDSRSEATEIVLGTEYPATLAKGDEDWFKFTTANDGYWDMVKIDIANKDNIVIGFSVYDVQGNKGIDFIGERGVDIPFVMYTPGGTYYIQIYSMNSKEPGDYSLRIYNLDANDNNEPDDNFDQALAIDTYPTGWLNGIVLWSANDTYPNGDWEYFYVKVNAGKQLDFSIDPESTDFAMHFRIYDQTRNLIDLGMTGTPGETLPYFARNTGASAAYFYIRVGGTLGESYDGKYFISFTESDLTH